MRYVSGQDARLGDRVAFSDHADSLVVCFGNTAEVTEDYPSKADCVLAELS